MAASFLELAREEAAAGYAADDPRRVRDAAEKGWLEVLQTPWGARVRSSSDGPDEANPPSHR